VRDVEPLRDIFLDAPDPTDWVQMSLRAALVFVVGVALMRLGSRRFPGQSTPFDLLLAVVLGSVLSRTINGDAVFVTTLAACATLVLAHWLFAWLAFRSHRFGKLIKGDDHALVTDGKLDWAALDACHITERDLVGALRLRCGIEDLGKIRCARLERTGEMSFILRE
jgi:uncharacterized membrane protein YcaP (DUF421 family)